MGSYGEVRSRGTRSATSQFGDLGSCRATHESPVRPGETSYHRNLLLRQPKPIVKFGTLFQMPQGLSSKDANHSRRWHMNSGMAAHLDSQPLSLIGTVPVRIRVSRIVSECCQDEKVIIFVARIKQGESLASLLQGTGLSAQVTHNRKDMNERLAIIQEFNEGRCQVLITCRIGLSGISLQGANSVILDRPPEGWDDFLAAVHKAGLVQDGKAYLDIRQR
ncbi:C-terminal helicase domain-containing protein [Aspergillus fischeri NRRL 181]|uniref:Helicase, putative n=1 Tax=Neosartorya fischeri (strain ATCC 1020 / DSM 3700 / CBS 544.65 / FGSC A1164 / JCM 1740 / NRRL 181 / WB 181) TaxID=331117 RepID=A1D3Y7_NEOFI|nr:helicase, putative [Aspergillus fischeri NRRL 181]EAW23130.1 helicase, putative [Aspergillus fischeri NRRL 181]KAG2028111.1 hypothetical protein GB937_000565 [Aspergillus fischeri]